MGTWYIPINKRYQEFFIYPSWVLSGNNFQVILKGWSQRGSSLPKCEVCLNCSAIKGVMCVTHTMETAHWSLEKKPWVVLFSLRILKASACTWLDLSRVINVFHLQFISHGCSTRKVHLKKPWNLQNLKHFGPKLFWWEITDRYHHSLILNKNVFISDMFFFLTNESIQTFPHGHLTNPRHIPLVIMIYCWK